MAPVHTLPLRYTRYPAASTHVVGTIAIPAIAHPAACSLRSHPQCPRSHGHMLRHVLLQKPEAACPTAPPAIPAPWWGCMGSPRPTGGERWAHRERGGLGLSVLCDARWTWTAYGSRFASSNCEERGPKPLHSIRFWLGHCVLLTYH